MNNLILELNIFLEKFYNFVDNNLILLKYNNFYEEIYDFYVQNKGFIINNNLFQIKTIINSFRIFNLILEIKDKKEQDLLFLEKFNNKNDKLSKYLIKIYYFIK